LKVLTAAKLLDVVLGGLVGQSAESNDILVDVIGVVSVAVIRLRTTHAPFHLTQFGFEN
jgi:hypothetical protein